MEGTKTQEELRAELIAKAAGDDNFRARLASDPKVAIKEALGLDLPESVTVQVHEESATTAHLVLPPQAALTDADLEGVAAGHIVREFGIYGAPRKHRHGDGRGYH